MQVAAASIVVGSKVWLEDPEIAWVDGDVVSIKDKEIKVSCSTGKQVNISCMQTLAIQVSPIKCYQFLKF